MRRVEIRDPINAEHHHLAVNHELPMPIFPCRLNNPRIPIGRVEGNFSWRWVHHASYTPREGTTRVSS